MGDRKVALALYRALSRCGKTLQEQTLRHGVTGLFTEEESLALQSVASQFPHVLYKMRSETLSEGTSENGGKTKARGELIRLMQDKFRSTPLPDATNSSVDPLSQGFAVLAMVNARLRVMEKMATEPHSDIVTDGVRVSVQSKLEVSRSTSGNYWFTYKVKITNESADEPVQLVRRHWEITDLTGKKQEVSGPGVIGEQPTIPQGKSYEYMSFASLPHLKGSMMGNYEMIATESGRLISAEIAPFALIPPRSADDTGFPSTAQSHAET
uniref:ApaG domain-containing protein n=1 Tax=Pyramimonas obovata TaxID=1411642 RepID=A0A7S0RCJ2_9CHLO|mmetsp:Transcript_30726/g.67093  ORF Transcript_30726/g.67093 Transcript_30726/m.67093 type:complete len:268 (+) Transcript_30726:94-897(+)|eukprot:CAMPEP_0118922814 /NCGR_PEP_ID=MMETSP1169-20130426/1604_1 /TAXON_ID=36882 /ORGANISM="Pyramimonas obovata, Strain CCMP722" /LENGTH=267 /DNA_ID=CAMNT_0006863739 /DNA_START=87 /DNA_END=890 /DNA_ORIENTATION=+